VGGGNSLCIHGDYGATFSGPLSVNTITIPSSRRIPNIKHELELTVDRGNDSHDEDLVIKDSFVEIIELKDPTRC